MPFEDWIARVATLGGEARAAYRNLPLGSMTMLAILAGADATRTSVDSTSASFPAGSTEMVEMACASLTWRTCSEGESIRSKKPRLQQRVLRGGGKNVPVV